MKIKYNIWDIYLSLNVLTSFTICEFYEGRKYVIYNEINWSDEVLHKITLLSSFIKRIKRKKMIYILNKNNDLK